jgi:hypothetical protein
MQQRKKKFNDTGVCVPERHYMVDISGKIKQILEMVSQGDYFVMNRPRQYGKTTTVYMLALHLKETDGYFPVKLSFEGLGSEIFRTETSFIEVFLLQLKNVFKLAGDREMEIFITEAAGISSIYRLGMFLTELIIRVEKKVVLIIDEIDKSSNNQLFLDFLGMLRDKYLKAVQGEDTTFHSVILVGVHDIKSLKIKLRSEEEAKYNSPWNIAVDFNVNMNFHPGEIATMLTAYVRDKKESRAIDDVEVLSQKLFDYTSGHPFLVSKLCKIVDEEIVGDHPEPRVWTAAYIDDAFTRLVNEGYTTTNFDEITKNLENNKELYDLVFKIIMDGESKTFNIGNPVISRGVQLGILADSSGNTSLHNKVYNQRIYNYMTSKIETSVNMEGYNYRDNFVMPDNSLDIEKLLLKFQEFMKFQHSRSNREFLEKDSRLVFLAFIKPIINGKGFDFKEVQVSEEKRLDVVLTYINHKYIIELKKWYGIKYHRKGIVQLSDYLERQSQNKGYLLIFDFRSRTKKWKHERIHSGDKEIFAIWV